MNPEERLEVISLSEHFDEVVSGAFVSSLRTIIVQEDDGLLDDPDEEVFVVIEELGGKQIAWRRTAEAAQRLCDFLYDDQVATCHVRPMRALEVELSEWRPWGED